MTPERQIAWAAGCTGALAAAFIVWLALTAAGWLVIR